MGSRSIRLAGGAVPLACALLLAGCGRVGYDLPELDREWSGDFLPEDAFEEIPGANYRSIGVAGTLHAAGEASVSAGASVVTFQGADLPPGIGLGDELVFNGETLYVQSVESPSTVRTQRPAAMDHVAESFELRRAFTTLQGWEDARQGELVAEDRLEIGVAYDDGPFTESLEVSGSTTDAEHFMWLTVARGHRHRGVAGTGARLRVADATGGANLVTVTDTYFRIHWLELDCDPGAGWIGKAILLGWRSGHNDIAYVLAYGGEFSGLVVGDYADDVAIRNSVLYGFGRSAIAAGGPHDGDIALLLANTLYGNAGDAIGSSRPLEADFVFGAHGNLVVGSGQRDFGRSVSYFASTDNISSDDSAPGRHALRGQPADAFFFSTSPGAEDLHLREGAPAVDRVTVLDLGESADIDGEPRPTGSTWDVGADELVLP